MTRVDGRICSRCVMDDSDPWIVYDDQGRCNHCRAAEARIGRQLLSGAAREAALQDLVAKIKAEGAGREHDCVIGVSGGVDSTYTAYWVKRLGLRPLAVHFDNGWNSELAVDNIKRTLNGLGIELYTYVVDWEEFRDLQLAFIRSGVPNCEAPTDHAITATLFRMANEVGTRFILSGSNIATESIMPLAWGHYNQDLKHLKAIHRRFSTRPLKTLPTIGLVDYLYYVFVKGTRQIPFLNYVDYDRDAAKALLTAEVGWRDYGGKHYESVWTRFFQGHYLPTRFGFDKRRAHFSSMIMSGQLTRDQALEGLRAPIYDPDLLKQDLAFVTKKFGVTSAEFEALLASPPRTSREYPGHHFLFDRFDGLRKLFRSIATRA